MESGVPPVPPFYRDAATAARITLVSESFIRLTGQVLPRGSEGDIVEGLWRSPQAIVAHGTEDDPLFFFGNAQALAAFETDAAAFIGMPSRYSAEAPDRAERQHLLDQVTHDGFISDYAGIRITATGRHFRIAGATVWNLVDADGTCHGQAATFVP